MQQTRQAFHGTVGKAVSLNDRATRGSTRGIGYVSGLSDLDRVRVQCFTVFGHSLKQSVVGKLCSSAKVVVVNLAFCRLLKDSQLKQVTTVILSLRWGGQFYPVGQLAFDFAIQRLLKKAWARFEQVGRQIRQARISIFEGF